MVLGAGPASRRQKEALAAGGRGQGQTGMRCCRNGPLLSTLGLLVMLHVALSGHMPVFHFTVSFISLVMSGAVLSSALA